MQTGLNLVYDSLLKGSTREASELLRNMVRGVQGGELLRVLWVP